eukprot:5138948-Lingulodinium_polyedra.AAC.1
MKKAERRRIARRYRDRLRALREARKRGYPETASPGTPASIIKMWLIGTGCGHDLITKSDAQT